MALTSGRGVRQGDPLGPLLFAASIQQHLRRTAAEHPEVTILAYADDIIMIGPATATLGALKLLTPLLAQDGLTCNLRKSSAWSTTPLEGDELPEGLPLTHEGVRVLGSPPQNRLLAALSEWHAWCAELLNTALTAASIQPPRREAEFNFLIRQATLPVALGGLGLTDPTTEAAPAYLASTTEALRLLRSLDLPATAALGSNSNALQPSAAHSVASDLVVTIGQSAFHVHQYPLFSLSTEIASAAAAADEARAPCKRNSPSSLAARSPSSPSPATATAAPAASRPTPCCLCAPQVLSPLGREGGSGGVGELGGWGSGGVGKWGSGEVGELGSGGVGEWGSGGVCDVQALKTGSPDQEAEAARVKRQAAE
ncbi:unnamed protein product [Closterium sp. Naga37s-1]|nr:unnamed protein product [Closterium sp. Naga37s-1]